MKASAILARPLCGLLLTLTLAGCQQSASPPAECPPLPAVDGYMTVTAEGGKVTLRVPPFAHVMLTQDCKQARQIYFDYLWHEGKLISEGMNRFKVPDDKRFLVRVGIRWFGSPGQLAVPFQRWRLEGAVRHANYPLLFYPRYYWEASDRPPPKDPPDVMWGIVGTRDPVLGLPYGASCSILRADPKRQDSVVNGAFATNGDSKCRGSVSAVQGDKAVHAMIDVWANGAPYIDKIFNAAEAELRTYLKDE